MFAAASRNFVEEVDQGGLLIPVSNLNDDIQILSVVVKRRRFWFWQKHKYMPTDFNLNDVLTGDAPLTPVTTEVDFIKYNGTYGDNLQGALTGSLVQTSVSLQGKDSSKLKSSFGGLKKEEVNVQKLLKESRGRTVDMSHSLIHQILEKKRQVLGTVKERILTTTPCSVIEEVQQGGACGVGVTFSSPKTKISLKENGSLSKDSNITMEIPPRTTVAYGLIELDIRHDGSFEMCLMSNTTGGFEVDAPVKRRQNSKLRHDLDQHQDDFQLLSSLPVDVRSSLLQHLSNVMKDTAAVRELQAVLEQMFLYQERSSLDDVTIVESLNPDIEEIVDLVRRCEESCQRRSVLTALHLLSSALDEMPRESCSVLGTCCSRVLLRTLDRLVDHVTGSGEMALSGEESEALPEETYGRVAAALAWSDVSLTRDGDSLRSEVTAEAGHRPLLLFIAVRGLNALTHGSTGT